MPTLATGMAMDLLVEQTELWKTMLQSPTVDTKQMLKVLTTIVTETVRIYSNQRYSFVLFTLLDNSSNVLAHFQNLENITIISRNLADDATILDPGGSTRILHNDLANLSVQSDPQPTCKGPEENLLVPQGEVNVNKKSVGAPSITVPQVETVQCTSSLEDDVSHSELNTDNVQLDHADGSEVSVELDSSLDDGSILGQEEIELSSENTIPITQEVVLNNTENVEISIEKTPSQSVSEYAPTRSMAGHQPAKRKKVTLTKIKRLSSRKVAKQKSCAPRSLQASCCIFCCEVINSTSVKEHYLSSHVQKTKDGGYIMKCQGCDHSYTISADFNATDLFSIIQGLEDHMALTHPMQSIYKCAACNFVTFSTEELASHSRSQHSTSKSLESIEVINQKGTKQTNRNRSQVNVTKEIAKKTLPFDTGTPENLPKLIKECIFCVDKENALKQITVTEFKKHFVQEHVCKENGKFKMKCPQCSEESVLADGESDISQLLYWGLHHLNLQHGANSNELSLQSAQVLHCKQCQFISTSKDSVCEHMKTLNASKTVANEAYLEIEEEEKLDGVRPPLQCFICPQEGSPFNDLDSCKEHFKSHHLNQKSSQAFINCSLCNAKFSCSPNQIATQLTYLIKSCAAHFSKVHGQPISQFFPRLKCPHCSYYSILKKDIWTHREEKHTNSMVCDKCGKVLKVHSLMSSHRHFCKGNVNKKKYRCSSCEQTFSSPGTLNAHFKVVHLKNQEHTCSFCQRKFSKRHNLELHVLHCHHHNSTQKETEKCPECGYMTFAGYQMENHMKSHTVGVYKCKHCEAEFPTRRKLYHHAEKKHTTKKMLQCEACNYKTREKVNMTQHINRIHKGMAITCSVCKYRALDETKLKAHMDSKHASTSESSNEAKSFPCTMCEKIFSTKHRMETHAFNIHNLNMKNKEIHQCSSCDYKAIEKSMLKLHMQNSHANLAIFICPICGRAFKSQGKLQNHKRRSHPVKNKFQCDECSYVTDSKSQYVLHHSRKHSGKRMKCPLCKYVTYQQHLYNRHVDSKHSKQEIAHAAANNAGVSGDNVAITVGSQHNLNHRANQQDIVAQSKDVTPSLFTMSWHPEHPTEVTVSSARNVHLVSQNPGLIGRTGSLCMRQTDLQAQNKSTSSETMMPSSSIESLVDSSRDQQVAAGDAESSKSTTGGAIITSNQIIKQSPQVPSSPGINQHGSFLQRLLTPSYWDNSSN